MGRKSAALAICCTVGLLGPALAAQPVLPGGGQPAAQPNPNIPSQGQPPAGGVPVFEPGPHENYVLVHRDDAGKLIPLDQPADIAAVWHVPMTDEEKEKVRQTIELREQILDASIIRRFPRALDVIRARGEEPITVAGSLANQQLGAALGELAGRMREYSRRGTLLNDPDLRAWMSLEPQLTEFGRVYRGWQGAWVAQAQQELRDAQAAGAPIEDTALMPAAIDHVRKLLELEQQVYHSLFRQYRAGEPDFFDDLRSLDLSSEQQAEIDRIQAVDDVDDLGRFLRIAATLTDDQNRELIKKRNPDTWESMLLPPKLATVPESVQPELPQIEGDGVEFALVSYDAQGRLQRLEEEPDLAALRALDLPQETRRHVEEIVAEREATFDTIVVGLAEELHWISITAPIEEMSELEMLINAEQVLDPIRAVGALMGGYYSRGDLLHDADIKEALTPEQHAEMTAIYDNFARAYLAQVHAQVEAGRKAGLEVREADIRETAAIHLLRMKDFVRKARQRLARLARAGDEDFPDAVRSAALPSATLDRIEPKLNELAELAEAEEADEADDERRTELFWDILTTLTPEQATRVLEPRLAAEQAPADG